MRPQKDKEMAPFLSWRAVLLAISIKFGTISQLLLVEPESTVVDVDEFAGGDVLGVMDAVGLNEEIF
jgi:hypothetical protein